MSSEIEIIQKLREVTGAGVLECQKAFRDARGGFEEAVRIIGERGLTKVEKRSGRETAAGLIEAYTHNGRIGVILDIRAETDFVVRSVPFKKLAHELVMQIAAMAPESVEGLLKQAYIKDESKTVDSLIKETSAKVGENIKINDFSRLEI